MVPTSLGGDYASLHDLCDASALIIVDRSSLRRSLLYIFEAFFFLVPLVTTIKNWQFGIASTMTFAEVQPLLTRLGSWLKCRKPFALVVAMVFLPRRVQAAST